MIQHRTPNRSDNGFAFRSTEPTFQGFGGTVLDCPSFEGDAGLDHDDDPTLGQPVDSFDAFTAPAGDPTPDPQPRKRGGAHRLPAPPTALKGRVAVMAVAAGAMVAAGQATLQQGGQTEESANADVAAPGTAALVAHPGTDAAAPALSTAPQVLDSAKPVSLGDYSNLLEKGTKFAQERAAAEAAKLRPLYVLFTHGTFTSNFGYRWGALHAGVDVAAPIGTPIYAVADGTVISAGPASGFGMWVRLQHADGTITVYGHVDTATVTVGQTVMAGDQIATVGNRGNSTGPHCHFEVMPNGHDRIDPVPWLAQRGISLGGYSG